MVPLILSLCHGFSWRQPYIGALLYTYLDIIFSTGLLCAGVGLLRHSVWLRYLAVISLIGIGLLPLEPSIGRAPNATVLVMEIIGVLASSLPVVALIIGLFLFWNPETDKGLGNA